MSEKRNMGGNRTIVTAGEVWLDIKEDALAQMRYALASTEPELRNEGYNLRVLADELSSVTEGLAPSDPVPAELAGRADAAYVALRRALYRIEMLRLTEKTIRQAKGAAAGNAGFWSLVVIAFGMILYAISDGSANMICLAMVGFYFAVKAYLGSRTKMGKYSSMLKDNMSWVREKRAGRTA